jgi:glycosidase
MALSKIRKHNSCFKDGAYRLIEARAGLFAFTRGDDDERVLVAVNVSDSDRTVTASGFSHDLLRDENVEVLNIKAGEAGIFGC